MPVIDQLIANNREWAQSIKRDDPAFFDKLARQQRPELLWIGCADSRVPANQIVGLMPGEVFVHRNVANVVVHSDLNCLSVLQFAVEVLEVPDVIVCGHYGCGGVSAALDDNDHGLIDNWLQPIRDVHDRYAAMFDGIADPHERIDRLCELNVMAQVINVCRTTVVRSAWRRGQKLSVHGFIYGIANGELTDLQSRVDGPDSLQQLDRRIGQRFAAAG